MAKVDAETVAEHRARLLELLPPGETVRHVLRHVSASGMTRWIDFYTVAGGELVYLTGYIEHVLEHYHRDLRRDGLKVSGAGMDMGFAVVYDLSSELYRGGFECIGDGREPCPTCEGSGKRYRLDEPCPTCGGDGWTGRYVGRRCPSNDHSNGDRDYGPHHHSSGGYALRSEWI